MKRKYIYTLLILVQVVVLLFVVSYAWIDGDFTHKKFSGNDLKISTTDELILSYKNETYSSLNLNTVISNSFTFSQVTSTGEYDSTFYKIDYSKELNNHPAEYVTAKAGTDYLVFDITLSTTSKAKRVYLDSSNSGFSGYSDDPYVVPSPLAANAMRCSFSFVDDNNVRKTILFANNADNTNRTVIASDLYERDTINNNQWYINGVPQYNKAAYAQAVSGGSGDFLSGKPSYIQNCKAFSEYDLNVSNENNILFDLQPYQSRQVRLIIWLEGSMVLDNDDSRNYIAGNKVRFYLKFSSSTNLGVDMSEKVVQEGMVINTIQSYKNKASSELSNYSIDYTHAFYKLTAYDTTTNSETVTADGHTYTRVKIGDIYYYKCETDDDIFYYNLQEMQAYLNYNDLNWKLVRDSNGTSSISGNNVIIGAGTKGDTFNLIGDVTTNGSTFTVVNEKYRFDDRTSYTEVEHIIHGVLNGGSYDVYTVNVTNIIPSSFTYVNNNGNLEYHSSSELNWQFKNGNLDFSTGVNNFATIDATYVLSVNINNYFIKKQDTNNNVSVSFNLVGYYNGNKVVNIIIVVVG